MSHQDLSGEADPVTSMEGLAFSVLDEDELDERRRASRIEGELTSEVELYGGARWDARTLDISVSGVRVAADEVLPERHPARVALDLPGLSHPFWVESVVQWSTAGEAGLRFRGLGAAEQRVLKLALASLGAEEPSS